MNLRKEVLPGDQTGSPETVINIVATLSKAIFEE